MIKINSVNINPNPVNVGSEFLLQISIVTWDSLKAQYTWETLKNSGETWESLRNKAIDMDFSESSWDAVENRYRTWNSLKRYGMTWNDLKGD
mgnify:FL=1